MSSVDGILIDMSIYVFHMGANQSYCFTKVPNPELCAPPSKLLPPDKQSEARVCLLLAAAEATVDYAKAWVIKNGTAKAIPETTLESALTEMFRQMAGIMKTWNVCEPWTTQQIMQALPSASAADVANIQKAQNAGVCHAKKSSMMVWLLVIAVLLLIWFVMKKSSFF